MSGPTSRSPRLVLRAVGRKLLLGLGGVLAGLLVAELALRLIYDEPSQVRSLRSWGFAPYPDPEIPYAHLPSCEWCLPETNSQGFLGPEQPGPAEGLLRVAMVGDSVCAGYPLHYAQTLPARLEARLTERAPPDVDVRVVSFCVGGFDFPELEAVVRKLVVPGGYDLVLLMPFVNDAAQVHFLTINDASDALYLLPRGERQGPFGWLPDEMREALSSVSYLFQEVQTRLAVAQLAGEGREATLETLDDERQRNLVAWEVAVTARAGMPLVVVPLPPSRHNRCLDPVSGLRPSADDRCDGNEVTLDWLGRMYRAWQVPVLDLRPAMRGVPARDFRLGGEHHDDLHYSVEGHDWLAEQIAPFVADRLWPPSPEIRPESAPPSP